MRENVLLKVGFFAGFKINQNTPSPAGKMMSSPLFDPMGGWGDPSIVSQCRFIPRWICRRGPWNWVQFPLCWPRATMRLLSWIKILNWPRILVCLFGGFELSLRFGPKNEMMISTDEYIFWEGWNNRNHYFSVAFESLCPTCRLSFVLFSFTHAKISDWFSWQTWSHL